MPELTCEHCGIMSPHVQARVLYDPTARMNITAVLCPDCRSLLAHGIITRRGGTWE